MPTLILQVNNELGLHAHPAAVLVEAVQDFEADIRITHNGREADAKSFIEVLGLRARKGSTISITATGKDAQTALDTIQRIVRTNFEPPKETWNED